MIDLNAALKELDRLIPASHSLCIKVEVWRFLHKSGPEVEQTISIWAERQHFTGRDLATAMSNVRDRYDPAPADLLVKEVEP